MSFWKLYFLALVVIFLISPALGASLGIPRLDTLMSPLNVLLLFVFLPRRPQPAAVMTLLVSFVVVFAFGLVTLLPPPSREAIADVMALPLPALLLLLTLKIFGDSDDPDAQARRLVAFVAALIAVPVLVEVATGFRFTPNTGVDETFEGGVFRGTFFNPNDMSTVATMMTIAVFHFFFMRPAPGRARLLGLAVLILLGLAIIVGGSRTATMVFVLVLAVGGFLLAGRGVQTLIVMVSVPVLMAMTNLKWLEKLLLAAQDVPMFAYSAQRLSLAIFAYEQDKSISYRSEIYTYFLDHFQLVVLGYGPRNFGDFFAGLSYKLAATNPHSFPIDAYLALGIFGAGAYVVALSMVALVLWRRASRPREQVFGLFALVVFLLLSFVPSSILRIPILWLPLMLIVAQRVLEQRVGDKQTP